MTIRLADVEPSPDVFAVVMATGILSIGAVGSATRSTWNTTVGPALGA